MDAPGAGQPTRVPHPYVRDRRTWLAFSVLYVYGFFLVSLGALLPYLRSELHLGLDVASLHLSVFSAGSALGAATAGRLERARGRLGCVLAGVAGLAAGGVALVAGGGVGVTLAASLALGAIGAWSLIGTQAALVDQHAPRRAVALSEAGVAASLGGLSLPLAVGLAEALASWRAAIAVGALAAALLVVAVRRVGVEPGAAPARDERTQPSRRLGLALLVLFAVVCVEGTLTAFSASFLDDEVGLSASAGVALTSALFGAMLAGRAVGGLLARRIGPLRLLAGALVLVGAAFPVLWLATTPAPAVAGLVLVGLGLGTFWPLGVAVSLETHPHGASLVSARAVMVASVAGVLTPAVLGRLAAEADLRVAFGLVPLMLTVAAVGLVVLARTGRGRAGALTTAPI